MGGGAVSVAVALRVCSVCGKMGFRRTYDLQRHMLSHTAARPFQCPHCPYRAALKYNLDAHMRLKHLAESLASLGGRGAQQEQQRDQQSCDTSDGGRNFTGVE
ncbi:Zinc finger Y-chromosomal protein [Portunus trituberculatus]|uniref:Zinc finger Y-chromosomal protein n=2 Tax=Portunus trituberculatus TaxID=210409 RepID=A0A5B7DDF5_PORTR|nr:Zinc finger Y-chromosomal protein [Portunus trituberculatus]